MVHLTVLAPRWCLHGVSISLAEGKQGKHRACGALRRSRIFTSLRLWRC